MTREKWRRELEFYWENDMDSFVLWQKNRLGNVWWKRKSVQGGPIQLGSVIVSSHAWHSCLSMEWVFVFEQGFGQTFLSGRALRVLYSQTFSMRKEKREKRNWADFVWNRRWTLVSIIVKLLPLWFPISVISVNGGVIGKKERRNVIRSESFQQT